jgi:hypothetical protein
MAGQLTVSFAFYDWLREAVSVYNNTEAGLQLSQGDFHSGTSFRGTLALDDDQVLELRQAMQGGYAPAFYVYETHGEELIGEPTPLYTAARMALDLLVGLFPVLNPNEKTRVMAIHNVIKRLSLATKTTHSQGGVDDGENSST